MSYKLTFLDHGEVELVECTGNDKLILDVARTSTGSSGIDEKRDRGLIRYLWRNKHSTPFEFTSFIFKVKCPFFVARQVFRHRIASYSEASARYQKLKFEVYIPIEWRAPGTTNHQGSISGVFSDEQNVKNTQILLQAYIACEDAYNQLLENGVANELARLVLPMGQYTEFYMQMNFRSLSNFLSLRLDPHAQLETRELGETMYQLVTQNEDFKWTLEIFEQMRQLDIAVSGALDKDKGTLKLLDYINSFED